MPIDPLKRYSSNQFPTYQPANRYILTISQSYPAVITTTFDGLTPGDNQYGSGLIVNLLIPENWGMDLANGFQGPITVISASQFTLDLDTTNFAPLVVPLINPGFNFTAPQVIPVGEITSILTESTENVLPYP